MSKRGRVLKVLAISVAVVVSLVVVANLVCWVRAEHNYQHNQQVWAEMGYDGLIKKQSDFADLRYGFGNVARNGCGAVAVYNILQLAGEDVSLPEIIRQFDSGGGENFFGLAGSKPSRVISVLKHYGFSVRFSPWKKDFQNIAESSTYSIFVYAGVRNFVPFGHYQLLYGFDGTQFATLNKTGSYTLDEICGVKNTVFQLMIGVNAK